MRDFLRFLDRLGDIVDALIPVFVIIALIVMFLRGDFR